jgi:hypothetical protein
MRVLVVDSVTDLAPMPPGSVVITGSHGGLFSGQVALAAQPRGAVFNDAGVGLREAGLAALAFLDTFGVAAATVGAATARIGDGADVAQSGIVSRCNGIATTLGVEPGMSCALAADRMGGNETPGRPPDTAPVESRSLICDGPVRVWALDSASLVRTSDSGAVVLTGSHGGLPGRNPARALGCAATLAAFNDAGGGKDQAGLSRLGALDDRQIPAVTVEATSARIGSGFSTYHEGILSHANAAARCLGATAGMPLRDLVAEFVHSCSAT